MKYLNKKDICIYIVIIVCITYLKSIYLRDIFQDENWEYQYFIYFGNNQFVNIVWLLPILVQVFFISKNCYMKMCYFDLRYKSRKNLLNKIFIYVIENQLIYVCIAVFLQIIGLYIFTDIKLSLSSYILEFFCKYFIEVMLYTVVLIYFSLLISRFTISFIIELFVLIIALMLFRISYVPIVTLFYDYHFNYITILCIVIMLCFIKKLYLSKDLLGGVKYDTKD